MRCRGVGTGGRVQPKTGFAELKHCALSGLGPPSDCGFRKIVDMAAVKTREARCGDEDELAEMRALLWPDATAEQHRQEAKALIETGMSGPLPGAILVALAASESLTGFIEVGLRSHADGCDMAQPVCFIEGWYVREGHQGRGVGRELMRAAEKWARARQCREMASDALIDNVESVRAHRALGFEEVDRCVHFRKQL